MKMNKIISLCILWAGFVSQAQEMTTPNSTHFELGEGLTFNLNNGDYQFFISGFIQPSVSVQKTEDNGTENRFNSRRSFFMLGGNAVQEKVSFLVQTDFSLADPLLDAWVAYHPYQWLSIFAGQKQNFVNNREMLYREDRLQFTDRSLNSQFFSRTGREFGLFVETKFGQKFGIAPKFSITSGDGRNSFGADSRDVDYGGTKIGGRLDLYPLGFFKEGNDLYTADLLREEQFKFVLGFAGSTNNGASNAVGEGHGSFLMYNENGAISLPDYTQIYADLLMKYQGFSMLLEFSNASASGLDGLFINPTATASLAPTQISQFLVLGNSYTTQLGYVTNNGLSFDARYENAQQEFENANSVLGGFTNYTFGVSKYFKGNSLKLQASVSSTDFNQGNNITTGELLFQIAF